MFLRDRRIFPLTVCPQWQISQMADAMLSREGTESDPYSTQSQTYTQVDQLRSPGCAHQAPEQDLLRNAEPRFVYRR